MTMRAVFVGLSCTLACLLVQEGCRKSGTMGGGGKGRKVRRVGDGSKHVGGRASMRIPTCDEKDDFLKTEEKKTLLVLARRSVEAAVRNHGRLDESKLTAGLQISEQLHKAMGAFVTLTKQGRLRGCIGYLQPIEPLYRAVINNARNAALRDRRFSPVQPEELASIEIEVSVLSVPVPVPGPQSIKIGCHGIILRKGSRRATYLPQVAPEQGWNVEQTLSHLSRKAGLSRDAWRSGTEFMVYTALVFSEKELRKGKKDVSSGKDG